MSSTARYPAVGRYRAHYRNPGYWVYGGLRAGQDIRARQYVVDSDWFVYGDFQRLHRTGLIACQYRVAEWRHKEVELAAHKLLQLLDETIA